MAEIIDLEMSDEEYLQRLAEGRDPVLEKLYERQLERLGLTQQTGAPTTQPATMRKKPVQTLVKHVSFGLIGLLVCLLLSGGLLQIFRGFQSEAPVQKQSQFYRLSTTKPDPRVA